MKKFFYNITKIGISIYLLLWCIQLVLDYGLKINKNTPYNELNSIYSGKINADLVFFGSSRALKHYNPRVFDTKLGINSFNLGVDGTALDFQRLRNKAYFVNNKKPQVIVQNIDITCLGSTKKIYRKYQYLPWYTLNNFKYLNYADKYIVLEYLIPMYKYRSYTNVCRESIEGYLGLKKENHTYKGFLGNRMQWNGLFEKEKEKLKGKNFDFSHINFEKQFQIFDKMLSDYTKNSNIIFLVWAPEYYERQKLEVEVIDKVKSEYKRLAHKYTNIYLIDFTKDSLCSNKKYFRDSYHLNKEGANIFSKKMADTISKYYTFKNKK